MKKTVLLENFMLGTMSDKLFREGESPVCAEQIRQRCERILPASVPGNFELDLYRAGIIPDPYYADNVLRLTELEGTHLYYYTEFVLEDIPQGLPTLFFGGIDTAAQIYIDGVLLGCTENMLISHCFPLEHLSAGRHELVVHITPALVYARAQAAHLSSTALRYSIDTLYIRKPGYMYGWDIMPRIVSAGLWKPVELRYLTTTGFEEVYLTTTAVSESSATLRLSFKIRTTSPDVTRLTYRVEGVCKDSTFSYCGTMFGSTCSETITVDSPYYWMPKNYGEPNLYHVTLSLYEDGVLQDSNTFDFGIRIAELERTSSAGEDGEFCFRVNGERIFVLGTNWVPTDAFPSRHAEYQPRALEMLQELGCNMIRCWGGNVYPDEELYDFCDRNGIMIWQDFCMACALYPDDARINALIEAEAEHIIKEKRNHPSLCLWSGDNECDSMALDAYRYEVFGKRRHRYTPDGNTITRTILPRAVKNHDYMRQYLPSSPYIDDAAFKSGYPAEDHLWGPRDFFKGEFYSNAPAHFASETGYHGCPCTDSLKRFIPKESLLRFGDEKSCDDVFWLTHAASPEPTVGKPYSYRIPLMSSHILRLFGSIPSDLAEYALKSQISQGEAKKYFIERFRISKWRRTGIIWWNLIDGWPQISDAVVDWYGEKKMAYYYIKRSQSPFCIMFSEPCEDGMIDVVAVNDTLSSGQISFVIRDLNTDELVYSGNALCQRGENTLLHRFLPKKQTFYLAEWSGDASGANHYLSDIGEGICFESYLACMKKAGFEVLEL